jgi:M6 family metalloprotease-like protein
MSRRRSIQVLLCLVIALALGLMVPSAAPVQRDDPGDRFSAVPLHPQVAAKLKAAGRKLPMPFPNSMNQGKKFNPGGSAIGPLATGAEQRVLVIFVEFSDEPPGGPAARLDLASYFDPMLFGSLYDPPEYEGYVGYPVDRTLKNYFSEVSYGAVDVVTLNMPSALGWTNVGKTHDYYCAGAYGFGWYPRNAAALVEDAVNAVDPFVDFSEYAVNGEVPNLFVVHAGTGAEWNVDPSLLWSHSWSLQDGAAGALTRDGVVVNNYALMPEVGGNLTGYFGAVTGPFPPTVGVYAHEYGHVLGLPDQYDYGPESNGTGPYSLMSYGSWNQWPIDDIFSGNSPAHLDAWSKYRLGFVSPVEITRRDTDLCALSAEFFIFF